MKMCITDLDKSDEIKVKRDTLSFLDAAREEN
jgi:hypothetical protein